MNTFKRIITTALFGFCLVMLITVAAQAADQVINQPIKSITVDIDKNGNEFVRVIVDENRSLGGVNYTAGVPVMFFGDQVDAGKQLQAGDTLKAVVNATEYQGNTSYTVRALIE